MVKPKDPYKITAQDLIDCGCGSTVISILVDVRALPVHIGFRLTARIPLQTKGFYQHDNREALLKDSSEGDDSGVA
jgi:hypothetical protein